MLTSRTERRSVKQNSIDRSKQWRDRFRKQCEERVLTERRNIVDRRRQDNLWQRVIQDEWEMFKKIHEQALQDEGIVDPDALFEDLSNIQEPPEDLDAESEYIHLHSAPILACVHCLGASLQPDGFGKLVCPKCTFRATEQTFVTIQNALARHGQQCPGRIGFAPEPGSDAILGLCDTCDEMEVF
ncbi:hypothetical protein BJV82DRAFT_665004 [Fennellomyces sp. T-0311]|nr:hypothetical protein BJV82DRAFT_665004 [Fennellomyces sp. T-0311]